SLDEEKVTGTIIQHKPKTGRKTFGDSLFLGRDENGKQLRKVRRGFSTEKDAQKGLREAIEEHDRPAVPERTMPTFAECFERWHTEVATRAHSPKTVERSYELAQYAINLFGDAPLDRITPEQLTVAVNCLLDRGGQASKQHPHGRPLAPKTVRHVAFL